MRGGSDGGVMTTAAHHIRVAALAAALLAALAHSPAASAYGWPVKPFDRQHPVRGFFGDPRLAEPGDLAHGSFHFGVDVWAPNGTPVYATVSGRVVLESFRPQTVSVVAADGGVLAYWHIVPAVANGARAVAYRTVLGHIAPPWEHVHLAESRDGVYLNPLRPGALEPFVDRTVPVVHAFAFERDGAPVPSPVRGRVDLVAEPRDFTPLGVPGPWHGRPVMPAVVRWRIASPRGASAWRTAYDVRTSLPAAPFTSVYGRWTRQNKKQSNGRYRILLARSFDTATLGPGENRLVVEVEDTGGNRSRSSAAFRVR